MRISDWSSDVCSSDLVPSRTAGRDQRFDYDVRPAFTAKMACRRVNPQAGCNPIEAVTLKFASPVARATALAATLSTADGQRLAAKASDSDRNDPWLTEVHFAGPLPQNVDATLALRSEEHPSELQSLMR